ncbi:MAG: dUTP diphosphatase [Candidatus Zambryskibacteria bacterium CG10_big_fil_rev_8_21_14_0_10_42_12]|uniref:dUTP diphosphatase n=1 Tax=Candidatus Zambryskibacteria bacterium CG10_big_fil_rev_8_21_14_0_10_42_12 TaxID=1975115 RepID=A0A2H0QYS5_9BACT|nr:MAG: dUTP diphosphatase [Candidatus Zambryskibacteria bacterium CG10_big_fil_rev_8_21_14_0_10_42_12]
MQIKIKKLHPEATLPTYGRAGDAGMDLYAVEEARVVPGETAHIKTGLSFELPEGYAGLVWDKSGLSFKHGIKVIGGVLDSNYRGELILGVINLGKEAYTFEKGHKVSQMLIQKIERAEFIEADELSDTVRGEQGFGSSGK